jgi:hypothetical protein
VSGWPGCALPSTPGSKKSASALASWCWPGRPPSSAAPRGPRSSRHRVGHRQRCTGRWRTRRGRRCRPCRCAGPCPQRRHANRAGPRLQRAAPAQPAGPETSITSPPSRRTRTARGAPVSGPSATGTTSPGTAGGTTATAPGTTAIAGGTATAHGTTAAGTTSPGVAPARAIGKGEQAKKVSRATTDPPFSVRPAKKVVEEAVRAHPATIGHGRSREGQ